MTTWPYTTDDEVSHLAIEDPLVLRARIDMLLEERHNLRKGLGHGEIDLPEGWRLTGMERRFFSRLVQTPAPGVATKESLHNALSGTIEPETEIKIVDVVACKVRKKLAPFGINFETIWGRGYRLSPDDRARVDALRA